MRAVGARARRLHAAADRAARPRLGRRHLVRRRDSVWDADPLARPRAAYPGGEALAYAPPPRPGRDRLRLLRPLLPLRLVRPSPATHAILAQLKA